ncbi:bifunctional hydroxymethylpyrimidine kinase/phosphomethylpyrimidine kinase [Desulfothermus naphthae]
MAKLPIALTIAGSDPSSGAGVQVDLKTFWENGVYGLSVITAITSQNSQKVLDVYGLPEDVVSSQLESLFEDFLIDSVKIGMLFSAKIVVAVSNILKKYSVKKIVLDPVIKSSSGYILLQDDGIDALISELIPMVSLITPNIYEASLLSGIKITDENKIFTAAKKIYKLGAKNVLIKGGHLNTKKQSIDFLYDGNSIYRFSQKRFQNKEVHGTGCIYSSAIAANLAKGHNIIDSVKNAKSFMERVLNSSLCLGKKGVNFWIKY